MGVAARGDAAWLEQLCWGMGLGFLLCAPYSGVLQELSQPLAGSSPGGEGQLWRSSVVPAELSRRLWLSRSRAVCRSVGTGPAQRAPPSSAVGPSPAGPLGTGPSAAGAATRASGPAASSARGRSLPARRKLWMMPPAPSHGQRCWSPATTKRVLRSGWP